jgi:hypothetical protein
MRTKPGWVCHEWVFSADTYGFQKASLSIPESSVIKVSLKYHQNCLLSLLAQFDGGLWVGNSSRVSLT